MLKIELLTKEQLSASNNTISAGFFLVIVTLIFATDMSLILVICLIVSLPIGFISWGSYLKTPYPKSRELRPFFELFAACLFCVMASIMMPAVLLYFHSDHFWLEVLSTSLVALPFAAIATMGGIVLGEFGTLISKTNAQKEQEELDGLWKIAHTIFPPRDIPWEIQKRITTLESKKFFGR